MGGLFKSPKIPGPTAAQQEALQVQTQAVQKEEARLAADEAAQAAARRARNGRNTGRALLLDDELGVTGPDGRPLATKVGA